MLSFEILTFSYSDFLLLSKFNFINSGFIGIGVNFNSSNLIFSYIRMGFKIGKDIHLVHAPERIIPGNMIKELKKIISE